MKISRKELDEFERAKKERIKPLNQKILDFLRQNIDSAFELNDIMKALEPEYVTSSGSNFDRILVITDTLLYASELNKLGKHDKIKSVRHGSKTFYYAIE